MKNAAKRDVCRELQTYVNHGIFERTWCSRFRPRARRRQRQTAKGPTGRTSPAGKLHTRSVRKPGDGARERARPTRGDALRRDPGSRESIGRPPKFGAFAGASGSSTHKKKHFDLTADEVTR